jgi:hypothetical protein
MDQLTPKQRRRELRNQYLSKLSQVQPMTSKQERRLLLSQSGERPIPTPSIRIGADQYNILMASQVNPATPN